MEQPPYSPNVVNQTVSYGGATWKGNPGTGWTQEGGASSSGGNVAQSAQDLLKMYQDANAPAVQSLQQSIPEIQAKTAQQGQYLQGKVSSLEERYKKTLESITGARDRSVADVTTNTSQELGRRGISAESGLFGQTVNKATQPIQQAFAGNINEADFANKDALSTLMNLIQGNTQGGIEQTRAVQNAIAQLQAGAGASSVTGALQMQQQAQAASEAQKQRDLQLQIAQMGQQTTSNEDKRYITLGDGTSLYDTVTGKIIAENAKTFAGTGGDSGW
jgi:hypothetical protein